MIFNFSGQIFPLVFIYISFALWSRNTNHMICFLKFIKIYFMKKLLKYPSIWLIVWQNRKFWVENISYSSLKSLSIVVSVMFDAEWIPGFFVCFFSSGTVSEVTNNCYNLYSLMKGFMNKIQSKRYCLKERWQETLY